MFTFCQRPAAGARIGVAFTDRHGGVSHGPMGALNLGRSDVDDPAAIRENFDRVRTALGVTTVLAVRQLHTADVLVADDALVSAWSPDRHLGSSLPGQAPLPVADAIVSAVPGAALCIRVADCLPILLADPHAGVIGAAHAGRRGLVAGVVATTVTAMRTLGAGAIQAWIGPHICRRCYEVPATMVAEIAEQFPIARAVTSWGTPALDLAAIAAAQLDDLGCFVTSAEHCTRTVQDLPSYRRDGQQSGRQAGFVWLT